jgi:hypothetical protein
MRVFKNKAFSKWAQSAGLDDNDLKSAVDEILRGLIDADLGGGILKKRVAIKNQGKSSGVRTLIAYKIDDKAFFVYGFAKNVRVNINVDELKALKRLAKELLSYSDETLQQAIEFGAIIELKNNE